jgi:hypothetical protein
MANSPQRKKYPADSSDSRNTSRGRDSILTGATKKRVDINYNTIKDEEGFPTGFSNRTKTVYKRVNNDLVPVKSKTKRVSDSRSYGQDAYAPQVQKKGGTITAIDQVDRMEKAKLLKNKK